MSRIQDRVVEQHLQSAHLREARRPVVASEEILNYILPTRDVMRFFDYVEDDLKDKQAADLARDVYMALSHKLSLTENEAYALRRLKASIERKDWDAATQRNNIFKAADLLKMKLPSHFFASDHSASTGSESLSAAEQHLTQAVQALNAAADAAREAQGARSLFDERIETQLRDMSSRVEDVQLEVRPLLRTFRNQKVGATSVTFDTFQDMALPAVRRAIDGASDASVAVDGMADHAADHRVATGLRQTAEMLRDFAARMQDLFRHLR